MPKGLLVAIAILVMSTFGEPVWAADSHDHAPHQHHQSAPSATVMDEHANHRLPVVAAPAHGLTLKVPDALLTDQDGRQRRLVSEVMGDKIIVANFVYTNCTTICPVASTLFSQLQDKLGDQLDSRVRLVSISVDPARDTPPRLKNYSESHGARSGWVWLTGAPSEVTAVLKGFGTYTANYKDHPVVIMIGDARSGQWIRYFGFQDTERLAAKVTEVLAAQGGVVPMAVSGDHHGHH